MEVRAQDPLWVIGNQQVHFPQTSGEAIRTSPLPTSFNPDIPDAYEYQGQVAQRTQNIQYDDEGKVLFFEIDGRIYNRDGLLLADNADDLWDVDCETCFIGGEEVHIFPVPGSCTRFFVVALLFENFQRSSSAQERGFLEWGVLDMELESSLPAYSDACVRVNGRFLTTVEVSLAGYNFLNGGGLGLVTPMQSNPMGNSYLEQCSIYSDGGGAQAIHGASIQVDAAGTKLLVVRCNQAILMLQVDASGITRLPGEWPTGSMDNNESQRGELALHLDGNQLRVAHSSYLRYFFGPLPCVQNGQPAPVHNLQVGFAQFNLVPGPLISVSMPSATPAPNPRNYSLDLYCPGSPYPLDGFGNDINRPAVAGLEFSPNGRYVYFVKSTDLAFPNSGGPQTTFGCIDLDWLEGQAGNPQTYLPIDDPIGTRRLCETQLGINTAPNGVGKALYMLGADAVGQYWLGAFLDPDNPALATSAENWETHVVEMGNIAIRSEFNSPATEHRLLNRRTLGATHHAFLQQELCCEALTRAKDRSTTIEPDDCDLTWEPGNNAFWNTTEPIHVATELRIAPGAHVVAQNMTFKFAEDARLVVERGASFKCTNCLFTNACPDKRWKGILVASNAGQHQWGPLHPTHQGELVLRASIVEHAVAGIRTGGGVIDVGAATLLVDDDENDQTPPIAVWTRSEIRNCHRGVMFRNYSNFSPSTGAGMHNRSRFEDVLFRVDADYMPDYGFQEHAWLWRVSGIPFIACDFENALPDGFFDIVGSQGLGHGIRSLDANFRVTGKCSQLWPNGGPPCPENLFRRSTFTGLDHGIHALQGSKLRNFTVDRAQFTDNICGVYADGVVGYVVKNSNFSVGNRNVAMTNLDEQHWFSHHRGIYSKRCYGFTVDDNTLYKTPGSPTDRRTEGVVIGYSQDHNDYVFRNHGRDLNWGFVGEGVSASTEPSYTPIVGLQMICNTNQNNAVNLSSRKANGATTDEQATHSIRAQQGDSWRQADNEFDGWVGWLDKKDFEVTTTYAIIKYWHQGQGAPYKPLSYDDYLAPHEVTQPLAGNCDFKVPGTVPPDGDGLQPEDVLEFLQGRKLAYGNVRYLYEQLIDGGSTDEVVEEITSAWPQDAWDLRSYLLGKSPFLSTQVLKDMMDKDGFPMAMKAEVCIANPEATQVEGFVKWLEHEASTPMPESLIAAIVASWDVKTYRTNLEAQLAGHHAAMSQAANLLLEHYTQDEEAYPLLALRSVWQEVRTPAARYAEALSYLDQEQYTAAQAVVEGIQQEHAKLRPKDITEKDRMLALIAFLQAVASNGRSEDEFTPAEQDQLETLIAGEQDRPATWAQNLLCFHYGKCASPWTGDDGEPKSLPRRKPEQAVSEAMLTLQPNPTSNWAVAKVHLGSDDAKATLRVMDVTGKQVATYRLTGKEQQVVLDTRTLNPGAYVVELSDTVRRLASENLIVQP